MSTSHVLPRSEFSSMLTRGNRKRDAHEYTRLRMFSEARPSCHEPLVVEPSPRGMPQSPSYIPSAPKPDECIFDYFYRIIFAFVNAALTIVLDPMLKKARSTNVSSACLTKPSPTHSDPEIAIPFDPPVDSSRAPRVHHYEQRRHVQKRVHFPVPERPRPPLGRICVSSSPSAASLNFCDSSITSSSSSSDRSRSSARGRVHSSKLGRLPLDRIRMSPSPRTHHSTYFLSD